MTSLELTNCLEIFPYAMTSKSNRGISGKSPLSHLALLTQITHEWDNMILVRVYI